MSFTKSCAGSFWKSFHPQETGSFTSPSMRKVQFARSVRGVGPAESTGKSFTRCCPGGMRFACAPAGSRRPTNPRVTNFSGMFPPVTLSRQHQNRAVRRIGHRGAKGHAPENTIAGFQKAIDLGCDGVETDVWLTEDGRLVISHDPPERDAALILEEVLDFCRRKLEVNVELKCVASEKQARQTGARVAEIIARRDDPDVYVSSFWWDALEGSRSAGPAVRRAFLFSDSPERRAGRLPSRVRSAPQPRDAGGARQGTCTGQRPSPRGTPPRGRSSRGSPRPPPGCRARPPGIASGSG